jgi:hypothetical protein
MAALSAPDTPTAEGTGGGGLRPAATSASLQPGSLLIHFIGKDLSFGSSNARKMRGTRHCYDIQVIFFLTFSSKKSRPAITLVTFQQGQCLHNGAVSRKEYARQCVSELPLFCSPFS